MAVSTPAPAPTAIDHKHFERPVLLLRQSRTVWRSSPFRFSVGTTTVTPWSDIARSAEGNSGVRERGIEAMQVVIQVNLAFDALAGPPARFAVHGRLPHQTADNRCQASDVAALDQPSAVSVRDSVSDSTRPRSDDRHARRLGFEKREAEPLDVAAREILLRTEDEEVRRAIDVPELVFGDEPEPSDEAADPERRGQALKPGQLRAVACDQQDELLTFVGGEVRHRLQDQIVPLCSAAASPRTTTPSCPRGAASCGLPIALPG